MQATEQLPLTNDQLLQKAILLNPHDDAPRLQYTDWLEARDGNATCPKCNGEGRLKESVYGFRLEYVKCPTCDGQGMVPNNYGLRAEFIRHQCYFPKLSDVGIGGLVSRNQISLWANPLPIFSHPLLPSSQLVSWRRGFIDEIHCTMDEFMKHGQAIARQHPVTKWVLTDVMPRQIWADLYRLVRLSKDCNHQSGCANGVIPDDLFDILQNEKYRNANTVKHFEYRRKTEAFADLEQACYHYARQGLEDHVPPPTPVIL